MRFSSSVRFIFLAGSVLFVLQRAIAIRSFRFPDEEILLWLLSLSVIVTSAVFYFLSSNRRMRFLLELATFVLVLEGLWILSRWIFSPMTSFVLMTVLALFLIYDHGKLKLPIYALGAAASALVYTFLLTPIHLLLLFGGLLIYDTLVFRKGLHFPHYELPWSLLKLQNSIQMLPLSYLFISLIFFSQLLYLHPVIGIVIWLLVLIALSQANASARRNRFLFPLGLLLPYCFALSLYHYAT